MKPPTKHPNKTSDHFWNGYHAQRHASKGASRKWLLDAYENTQKRIANHSNSSKHYWKGAAKAISELLEGTS